MKMIATSMDMLTRSNNHYKPGKVQAFISEFIASNKDIVEVTYAEDEYATPYSCTAAMTCAIKGMKMSDSLCATTVDHHCYLYRKDRA